MDSGVVVVDNDSGDEKTKFRMTTILQRRIIVWGGGEDRQDREARV